MEDLDKEEERKKERKKREDTGLTLSSLLCQYGDHSAPAASMHASTALASSGRMERIRSLALGERRVKLSQAS
jgi:hypothetical protein